MCHLQLVHDDVIKHQRIIWGPDPFHGIWHRPPRSLGLIRPCRGLKVKGYTSKSKVSAKMCVLHEYLLRRSMSIDDRSGQFP